MLNITHISVEDIKKSLSNYKDTDKLYLYKTEPLTFIKEPYIKQTRADYGIINFTDDNLKSTSIQELKVSGLLFLYKKLELKTKTEWLQLLNRYKDEEYLILKD